MSAGFVYLLHFDTPLAHARHYIGSTDNLERRLKQHSKGRSACIMRAVTEKGITWRLARTWPYETLHEARLAEHHFKESYKNARRTLCPICREERNHVDN